MKGLKVSYGELKKEIETLFDTDNRVKYPRVHPEMYKILTNIAGGGKMNQINEIEYAERLGITITGLIEDPKEVMDTLLTHEPLRGVDEQDAHDSLLQHVADILDSLD